MDELRAHRELPDVFVSYNRNQKKWVRKVVDQWRALKLNVFFDLDCIPPGSVLIPAMQAAIVHARKVVVFLDSETLGSPWVRLEIDMAMTEDPDGQRQKLIPVFTKPIGLHTLDPALRRLSVVDLCDKERESSYHSLLRSLGVTATELPPIPDFDDDETLSSDVAESGARDWTPTNDAQSIVQIQTHEEIGPSGGEKLREVLTVIQAALNTGNKVTIRNVGRGRNVVTVDMNSGDARKLVMASETGALDNTDVKEVAILSGWTRDIRPPAISEMMGLMARPGVISFALGLPAPELFPLEEYAAAATRVLRDDTGALQYRPPYAPLKAQIVDLMAQRGVHCRPEQIFLTTAGQQGLSLLSRILLEPRGTVICEELVYTGFQQVIETYQPNILTVGTDLRTGIDVDAIGRLLEAGERPAFIYCITDGHNPLGVSISPEKRLRLAELARAHRVPIIEDDAYGLLHFGSSLLPMRAVEDRWVFYVGSFSKVLAPSFRVGWLVVPEELTSFLGVAKDAADIQTSTFTQRIVSDYLASGHFPGHLARVRESYRERRDLMIEMLRRHFPAGTRWSVPNNGALLWAELPEGCDAGVLLREALEHEGVSYVPGTAFSFDGIAGSRGMRLNFSLPSVGQIRDGMEKLGRAATRLFG